MLREEGGKVEIYFESVGPARFDASVAELTPVDDGEVGPGDLLRNIKPDASGKYVPPPLTFDKMVANFRAFEKGGFDSEHYIRHERTYKEKAATLAASLLEPGRLKADLDRGDYDAIFDAHRKVVNATNLLYAFDKVDLGKVPRDKRGAFAKVLVGLLAEEGNFERRFDELAETFADLDIGSWPTCTYALFLTRPHEYLFVKPMYVQRAAEALNYEIQYESRPNSKTYRRILNFAGDVRKKLVARGMPPRDMIDVQGFLWAGAGGLHGG